MDFGIYNLYYTLFKIYIYIVKLYLLMYNNGNCRESVKAAKYGWIRISPQPWISLIVNILDPACNSLSVHKSC